MNQSKTSHLVAVQMDVKFTSPKPDLEGRPTWSDHSYSNSLLTECIVQSLEFYFLIQTVLGGISNELICSLMDWDQLRMPYFIVFGNYATNIQNIPRIVYCKHFVINLTCDLST